MRATATACCPAGHIRTPETTLVRKDGYGMCRVCNAERQQLARAEKRVPPLTPEQKARKAVNDRKRVRVWSGRKFTQEMRDAKNDRRRELRDWKAAYRYFLVILEQRGIVEQLAEQHVGDQQHDEHHQRPEPAADVDTQPPAVQPQHLHEPEDERDHGGEEQDRAEQARAVGHIGSGVGGAGESAGESHGEMIHPAC